PGAVRLQPHLLSRHHRARLDPRRRLRRQGRGRKLAALRLARQDAALRVCRSPGAQHRRATRRDVRTARQRRGADPFPRGHQPRRQPRAPVQERALQRRRPPSGQSAGRGAAGVGDLCPARRPADRARLSAAFRLVWRHGDGAPPMADDRARHAGGRHRIPYPDDLRRVRVAKGARRLLRGARRRRRQCRADRAPAARRPCSAAARTGRAGRDRYPRRGHMRRLYIKTYGCQMNVYDSARMAELMAPLGYEATQTPSGADLVILNTCHIREKAAEKVYSELGAIRRHKRAKERIGGNMVVAVAGCVAQAEGAEIMERAPVVDMVFGPQAYHRLPEMVAKATRAGGGVLDTSFPPEAKFDHLPARSGEAGVSAFLTIQEGCDKFCTFCVVPYTRGAEFSRPAAEIVEEARSLVENGAREITLLGQNVNAYHGRLPDGGDAGLGGLLRRLAEIPRLLRLRYTTSHPRDVDDELVGAHRDLETVMPFLHLPVQSGADRVLANMNRRHTADDYRRTIGRLRAARPDLAFSSDFIVGFPGETDADFLNPSRSNTRPAPVRQPLRCRKCQTW